MVQIYKHVDGCTLIPWQCGKAITWDVTIPDTLAQSQLPKTSCVGGAAAEDASLRKIAKYTGVRQRYDFVAIAVDNLGPMNEDVVNFLLEIGRRLSSISGDSRETSFLLQRVYVTLSTLQRHRLSRQLQLIGGVSNSWLRSRGV